MNGHRSYSGVNVPHFAVKQIDRQGYSHKTRLTGPIQPMQVPGLLARVFGK